MLDSKQSAADPNTSDLNNKAVGRITHVMAN